MALRLAVWVGVEACRKLVIHAHVGANWIPASAGELGAAVGDDIIKYAMLADHVFDNHLCQFQ
jgi:hypothetical protein